jgi:hypothetical protein
VGAETGPPHATADIRGEATDAVVSLDLADVDRLGVGGHHVGASILAGLIDKLGAGGFSTSVCEAHSSSPKMPGPATQICSASQFSTRRPVRA